MCRYNRDYLCFSLFLLCLYFPTQAYRKFKEKGKDTILAIENEEVNVECRTDMPIAYCGFIHSNTRYSFSGHATNVGKCSIKIKATMNQTGEWRCHIGSQSVGEESMQHIELRVVKEIAAVEKNIKAMHGRPQTLYCTTTTGFIPLSYCRFEPPNNYPFGIDSSVTQKNPLLKRYYFPANKSLDRGDCAVTIQKVNYKDVGTWTCGAGFDDGTEHTDIINFEVEGLYMLSTASVIGITIGSIGIIAFLCILGFVASKKRRFLGIANDPEIHELQQVPSRVIPSVVVQSPSDPGTSSPLMPENV